MMSKVPFTVIGGYLGSGKTTLLNHLLANTEGLRIAVLVNDFGRVNIDAGLIRSHAGDTITLTNGCICCSIADNFALVMGQLLHRASDFDHIIIEASGVALPAKIAQYGHMYRLPLDGIVVVADAEQVRTQAQNKYVGDTVLRQFNQADLIILNKTDLVSGADLANLRSWFADIAPGTPRFETVQAEVPTAVLLGAHRSPRLNQPLSAMLPYADHGTPQNTHGQLFETWTLSPTGPLSRETLAQFATGMGEDIYRAKGVVWLEDDRDRRYIYQQVGSRWSLVPGQAWGDASPSTQLVVIGRQGSTDEVAIAALLQGDRVTSLRRSPSLATPQM
jgi:G3E family GTPase